MKIIIDCMSGDNAPGEIVKGAITGCKEHGVDGVLVGEKAVSKALLRKTDLILQALK